MFIVAFICKLCQENYLTLLALHDIIIVINISMIKIMQNINPNSCPPGICGIFNSSISNTVGLLMVVGGALGLVYGIINAIRYFRESNPNFKGQHLSQAVISFIFGALIGGGGLFTMYLATPEYFNKFIGL